tara:strand:- start:5778 stop:6470 length:693 start_codon:yes stop_codon:yes gene_type:complete
MYENIIIIPFRNRETHLDYFVKHSVPLIEKHLPNTKVLVIEQTEGKIFNRGMLLNVGFKEYQNKTKYFITHDVDINPTEKCILEVYNKKNNINQIIGILLSPYKTLAPIIKINNSDVKKINGFPNNIWGWGTEDKALHNRAEYYNLNINPVFINNDKNRKDDYFNCFDDVNDRVRINESKNYGMHYILFRTLSNAEKEKMIMSSGLNNLEYSILERKMIHNIVELIKVDI